MEIICVFCIIAFWVIAVLVFYAFTLVFEFYKTYKELKKLEKNEDKPKIVKCCKCKHLIEEYDATDIPIVERDVLKRIPTKHMFYCENCKPNYDYIKTNCNYFDQYFKTFEVDEKGKIKK